MVQMAVSNGCDVLHWCIVNCQLGNIQIAVVIATWSMELWLQMGFMNQARSVVKAADLVAVAR